MSSERVSTSSTALPTLPILSPPDPPAAHPDADPSLLLLRRFHLGDTQTGLESPRGYWPTLLWTYRTGQVRYDYPLVIEPTDQEVTVTPLTRWLSTHLDTEAHLLLRDNQVRLEQRLHPLIAGVLTPQAARPLLLQAGTQMQQALQLAETARVQIQTSLDALCAALPESARLLGYSPHVGPTLLLFELQARMTQRRQRWRETVQQHVRQLRHLLETDDRKAGTPDPVGTLHPFNGQALAQLKQGLKGTLRLSASRRARIEATLATLEQWLPQALPIAHVIQADDDIPLFEGGEGLSVTVQRASDPLAVAAHQLESQAQQWVTLCKAMRVAALDIAERYDPAIHTRWFAEFDAAALTETEWALLPTVIVFATEAVLMRSLTTLVEVLHTPQSCHVLALADPLNVPTIQTTTAHAAYRVELPLLAMGLRDVWVSQTSAARPCHLVNSLQQAVARTQSSLHVLDWHRLAPAGESALAWLLAGAAIESRAHPLLRFDPKGTQWKDRAQGFADNPQADQVWPRYPQPCRRPAGEITTLEVAFTWADFALLESSLTMHFGTIPMELQGNHDLIPLSEYVQKDPESAEYLIPFIWAVDPHGVMRQLAISRRLVMACRDRMHYWRTLQEWFGVQNSFVEQALHEAYATWQAQAAEQREALQTRYQAEWLQVRQRTAREVAENFARRLMQVDEWMSQAPPFSIEDSSSETTTPERLSYRPESSASTVPAPSSPSTTSAVDQTPTAERHPEEPRIDSAACISCNECIDRNPRLFVYNANKQAVIGNKRAGTYAQLVEAAEACPAKCIYPGTPFDPSEPDLEALWQRAMRFR